MAKALNIANGFNQGAYQLLNPCQFGENVLKINNQIIQKVSWSTDNAVEKYSKASRYTDFGSRKKMCILKTVHHEVGKIQENPRKIL